MTTKELLKKEIDNIPDEIAKNMYKLLKSWKDVSVSNSYKDKKSKKNKKNVDETEYLLKLTANKNKLLSAMNNVKNRKNLREIKIENLK